MPDLRLIDLDGLHEVASMLSEAASVVLATGRGLSATLMAGSPAAGIPGPLSRVAAVLEMSASDLRRREIEISTVALWCTAPALQIHPRRVHVAGVDGSSTRQQSAVTGDHDDGVLRGIVRGEWGAREAVRHTEHQGQLGTFSAAALAAEGYAAGRFGLHDGALEMAAEADLGLHLVQFGHVLDTRFFDTEAEAFVGAEASIEGNLSFDLAGGDGGFEGGLTAFIGMAAAAEVGVGPETARVIAGGQVGIGLGADLDAAVGLTDGVFDFDFGASAFLGLGGGFDVSLEVDLAAIGEATLDVIEGATDWISSLWP